jgi:hypothetical protein
MTDPAPITTGTSASEHAARYEALRRHAIGPHHAPAARDGLAVLLRQGVTAWMEAWSRLPAPAVRAAQDESERPPLPDGVSAEVIRVLAAMALGHIEEVHA